MTFKQYIVEKTDLETSLINKLGREIVDASNRYILPPEKDFTAHQLSKKGFRVKGSEEVKTEPFQVAPTLKNIADTIGATFDMIPPKGANAKSGRFVTYLFTKNDITVPIVITNTKGNVGLTFESNVSKSFKSQFEDKQLIPGGLFEKLIEFIPSIKLAGEDVFENIKSITYHKGKAAKRVVSQSVDDVGEKVSDLNINLVVGKPVYLSLKTGDATLSNSGITGMFTKENNHEIRYTDKQFVTSQLLNNLHVDYNRIATGLTGYDKKELTTNNESITFTPSYSESSVIIDYLASAYGYGYWYLEYDTDKHITLIDLNKVDNVRELVGGSVKQVTIKYPMYVSDTKKSKQLSINILTENGAEYRIEVRNEHGGIIPTVLQIKNTKEPTANFDFIDKFTIETSGETI